MSNAFKIASLIIVLLFFFTLYASYAGWGESQGDEMARARSVRTGSLHTRHVFGGTGK